MNIPLHKLYTTITDLQQILKLGMFLVFCLDRQRAFNVSV